ncbi:MAG: rhodanese-like domain-containing protein [Caldilineaceae bacterium]
MSTKFRYLVAILMILTAILSACGGGQSAAEAPAPAAAPLAQEAAAPTEAPAAEAAPTEAPAAEVAPAEGVDLAAVVDEYMSNIPDGFMNVGKLDAFKEILATGEAVIIDVRTADEYAAGHIAGAVNVPLDTLAQSLDKIPTDKPVMVYCASGHRAGMALSSLRILGYDNARAFSPGWKGWSAANEPAGTEAVAGETYTVPEIDPALLTAVDGFLSAMPEGYFTIGTVEKLEEAMAAGAVLVDVREPGEVEEGAITGAINIPLRTVAASLDQIPQDQPVVVYCASGFRAALATGALHVLGYENVRAFPPSYAGWESAQGEDGDVPTELAAAVEAPADLVGLVDEYLSAIPEGYMAVGKIDAFKEVLASASPLLIDVREESEYAEGHISGAINIPIRTLAQNLDKIPTDQPVMVYCASGHRAGMATSALHALGYGNVKAFPPGWKGWTAANEPVSTEPVEAATYAAPEVNAEMLAAVDEFLSNIPEGFYALGTVDKLKEAMDAGAVVIDVREESEYVDGHIAGAIDIPIRTLAQNLDKVPADQPVVVYCASGFRAALSTAALHIMGYSNVRAFPPSYAGWESAGEATE